MKKKWKKNKKKPSENDQLTGHFQSFFIYFFRPPYPKSEKKIPVNQLIKKFWPYVTRKTQPNRSFSQGAKYIMNILLFHRENITESQGNLVKDKSYFISFRQAIAIVPNKWPKHHF